MSSEPNSPKAKNVAAGAKASRAGNKAHVWTAEELKKKWEAEARGEVYKPQQDPVEDDGQPVMKQYAPGLTTNASTAPQPATPANLRMKMETLLKQYGVEPAEELIRLATAKTPDGIYVCDLEQRERIWGRLLDFSMPKLKSVEHSGHVDHGITVVVKKFGGEEVPMKRVNLGDPVLAVERQ